MANIPQKSSDPTEDALQAIRDALATGQGERSAGQTERRATPPTFPDAASEQAQTPPPADADLTHEEPQPETWDSDKPALPRQAANDDRANLGRMLQAMHSRPARTPFIVASVAAVAWTAGGLATASLFSDQLQALFATPRLGIAAVIGLVCAFV